MAIQKLTGTWALALALSIGTGEANAQNAACWQPLAKMDAAHHGGFTIYQPRGQERDRAVERLVQSMPAPSRSAIRTNLSTRLAQFDAASAGGKARMIARELEHHGVSRQITSTLVAQCN